MQLAVRWILICLLAQKSLAEKWTYVEYRAAMFTTVCGDDRPVGVRRSYVEGDAPGGWVELVYVFARRVS